MIGPDLHRAAPWLARVVGPVQGTAAPTTLGTRLRSQFMVDTQQQREELRVLQQGMAHLCGLRSWSKGDSPTEAVYSRSLREIFYGPSRCLIKSAATAIKICDRAHLHLCFPQGVSPIWGSA